MPTRLSSFALDRRGATAATVALALSGILVAGGVAFDYARLATVDTELQQAADQAALAAVTQLDGKTGACDRAVTAATSLVSSQTKLANDGGGISAAITTTGSGCTGRGTVTFYSAYTSDTVNTPISTNGDDANAKFVRVQVNSRQARDAFTPIVARAMQARSLTGAAVAGLGTAICKVPPVMICNPDEPIGNTNKSLIFNANSGVGLLLVTGDATLPGNFGWLDNGIEGANGAGTVKTGLSYDNVPGNCISGASVVTKTGMIAGVLDAINTRFDVYSSGNNACPSNGNLSGTCSPSVNSRKDLTCNTQNANSTACKSANNSWGPSSNPYRPTSVAALPSNGTADPDMMGYPLDLCHAVKISSRTCGTKGSGTWDRDAYFRVNYGYNTPAAWQNATRLSASASRYDVYRWEIANPSVTVGGVSRGIGVPQRFGSGGSTSAAFGSPATGRTGITPGASTVDRRRLTVPVVNCRAEAAGAAGGGSYTTTPPIWYDVFLVQPSIQRGNGGNAFTEQKEVYVEVIAPNTAGAAGATAGQVVRRDKPYLIE